MLAYAHQNAIEAFLEPAVELSLALLQRDSRELAAGDAAAGHTRSLVANMQSYVAFCNAGDTPHGVAAAACVVHVSEVRPPAPVRAHKRAKRA